MVDDPARRARLTRLSPALSLREACRRAGQDREGQRCPDCPLRTLCVSEARWVVRWMAPDPAGDGYLH